MKYLPAFAAVCLLIVPSVVLAQQITPNPNLSGNEIWVETPHITNDTSFVNNGMINITSAGTLTNNSTMRNSNQGYVLNDGHLNNKATLGNYEGSTLYNKSTFENLPGATLTNEGNIENSRYMVNRGTLNNTGVWVNGLLTGGKLNTFGRLINAGALTNTGKVTITQENSTGWTLANIHGGTLTNKEMLINNAGSTLLNAGTLINAVGGKLTNHGTIDTGHGTFTNHGTLNGSGHIKGSYTDHGHTKPGNSAGLLTIDGDYFKVAGSKEVELGGLLNHDRIDVTGNVELAGQLNVELIDGFELHRGNWFDFLTVGGTLSGQYEGLAQGDLVGHFGGQDLFIDYSYSGEFTGVALYTNAVPEPTTVLIWSMLAGLGMTVRRRR